MQVAREQDEPQRLPRSPAAERLRQEQRALEAALCSRRSAGRDAVHLQRRCAPRVHHAARAPPACPLPDESTVVLVHAGSQGAALLGCALRRAPARTEHCPPVAAQPLGQRACRIPLLAQDQPAADGGLRAAPVRRSARGPTTSRREGRPGSDVRSLGDGGVGRGAPALDPVALALEGVGGQGDPAAALARGERRPVDARPRRATAGASAVEQAPRPPAALLPVASEGRHRRGRPRAGAAAPAAPSVWPGPTSSSTRRCPPSAARATPSREAHRPRRCRAQ